jgi:tetratricopeptide (TPR) repeat protein
MNKVYITAIFYLSFGISIYAQNNLYEQARTFYTNEQYEEALPLIRQSIESDSVDYRLFILQGRILENLIQYKPAIESYNEALRLNGENSEVKSLLAALYYKIGRLDISANMYNQLIEANPEITRWKISHASILQQLGKYEQSLRLLRDVVSKDSLNWTVYKDMGNCYFKLNKLDSAALCFTKSLDIYPNNISYINLMKINIINKNYLNTLNIGSEALKNDQTKVEIWQNIGLACFFMDMHQNSIDAFKIILELGDTTYTTSSHLGMLYYITGNDTLGIKYLEMALKQQPDELEIMYMLAKSYETVADFEKSISMIDAIQKKVRQLDSLAIRAEIIKGNVFRKQNHYEKAVKVYSDVLQTDPSRKGLDLIIAGIYDVNLGSKKDALKWYIRYLNKVFPKWEKQDPEESSYLRIKSRIEQLKTDLFFEMEENK